jgi:hypothetical protein
MMRAILFFSVTLISIYSFAEQDTLESSDTSGWGYDVHYLRPDGILHEHEKNQLDCDNLKVPQAVSVFFKQSGYNPKVYNSASDIPFMVSKTPMSDNEIPSVLQIPNDMERISSPLAKDIRSANNAISEIKSTPLMIIESDRWLKEYIEIGSLEFKTPGYSSYAKIRVYSFEPPSNLTMKDICPFYDKYEEFYKNGCERDLKRAISLYPYNQENPKDSDSKILDYNITAIYGNAYLESVADGSSINDLEKAIKVGVQSFISNICRKK